MGVEIDDDDGCVRACVGVGSVDGDARENEGDEREDERDGVVVVRRVVVTAVVVVVGDRARISFIAAQLIPPSVEFETNTDGALVVRAAVVVVERHRS